jgi:putative zinc finger/helix-turn-helix YgiT family protein
VPAVCPGCSKEGLIEERMIPTTQLISNEEIQCDVKKWVCSGCNAAFMSPKQATDAVKRAVAVYQVKHGLLTAEEIREGRKKKGLTVSELAEAANLGEATIKRLEAGTSVQRLGTNTLLLTVFNNEEEELPDYSFTMEYKYLAGACSALLSKWLENNPWNAPDPWNSQNLGADNMMLSAADSNELALAA